MRVLEEKSIHGWLDWLEVDGPELAARRQDVRVRTHSGVTCLGSVSQASSVLGKIVLNTYEPTPAQMSFDIEDLSRVEVFQSCRHGDIPARTSLAIEGSCP